eukprot:CAMPEP_0114272980 /NCGR_PEP_ID=MMETSP0058-20121206/28825_1 /TAXON_ID=36894 /ORGANISM="Pyramimonas parkeae, CCMP726" /LENGTH=684 /DNA_ID=CAMNT_0001392349 /DNA_START=591 /DNA_END=2646 /DNA_ORIENTATION=+
MSLSAPGTHTPGQCGKMPASSAEEPGEAATTPLASTPAGAASAVAGEPESKARDAVDGQEAEGMETQPNEEGAARLARDLINKEAAEKQQAAVMDELKCAICHEAMVNAHILRCTHTFCGLCIWKWVAQKRTCPFCRERCGEGPIEQPLLEKMIVMTVEPSMSEEERASRQEKRQEFMAYKLTSEFKATSAREPPRPTPTVRARVAPPSADITALYMEMMSRAGEPVSADAAELGPSPGGGGTDDRAAATSRYTRRVVVRNHLMANSHGTHGEPRRWRARPAEAESSEANGAGADSAGEIEIVEGAGVEAGDEEQHRRARAQRYPAGETDGRANQQSNQRRQSEVRSFIVELRNVARTVASRAGWGAGSRDSTGTTSASLSDAARLMIAQSMSLSAPGTHTPGQSAPSRGMGSRDEMLRAARRRAIDSERALVPPWWPEPTREDHPPPPPTLSSWSGSFGGGTELSNDTSHNHSNGNRQRRHSLNDSLINSAAGETSALETARSPAREGAAWLSAARRPPPQPAASQAPSMGEVTVSQNLAGYELGRNMVSVVERHQRGLMGREGAGRSPMLDLLGGTDRQGERLGMMRERPEGWAEDVRAQSAMLQTKRGLMEHPSAGECLVNECAPTVSCILELLPAPNAHPEIEARVPLPNGTCPNLGSSSITSWFCSAVTMLSALHALLG